MKTAKQREEHFRKELEELLNRHQAAMIITDDGADYGMHRAVCEIHMSGIYNDDGDLLADWCEFWIR